jgi:hypothetical protein
MFWNLKGFLKDDKFELLKNFPTSKIKIKIKIKNIKHFIKIFKKYYLFINESV